jgi:hypothetical protein
MTGDETLLLLLVVAAVTEVVVVVLRRAVRFWAFRRASSFHLGFDKYSRKFQMTTVSPKNAKPDSLNRPLGICFANLSRKDV